MNAAQLAALAMGDFNIAPLAAEQAVRKEKKKPVPGVYSMAAVLVIERRVCSCGREFDCPCPVIHELSTSHEKDEFRQTLTVWPSDAPDQPPRRTVRIVVVPMQACQFCWTMNTQWDVVAAERPPAPKERPNGTMAEALAGLKIFREPTLESLI
jgi:hypothetical protein